MKSKKKHRLSEEELVENKTTNPGHLEKEHFQRKGCLLASSLQSKEHSLDKKGLLRIINKGQFCSVFAILP